MRPTTAALSILLFLFFSSFSRAINMKPIDVEHCRENEWIVRNHIVYVCHHTSELRRDIKPFACDPTNGVDIRNHKAPLFPGREIKKDGFIYACELDPLRDAIVYRAKACFDEEERIYPGKFIVNSYRHSVHCNGGLDMVLRKKMKRPIHDHCHDREDDACWSGETTYIESSVVGMGQGYSFNPTDGKPIMKRQPIRPPTTEAPTLSPFINVEEVEAAEASGDLRKHKS